MQKSQIKKQLGNIVQEGFLYKQSRIVKSWRQRWVVLTDNLLLTFKEQKSYDKPTQVIALKQVMAMKSCDDNQRPNVFKVQTTENTFYFSAESSSQRQKWLAAVGKSVVKSSKKYNEED